MWFFVSFCVLMCVGMPFSLSSVFSCKKGVFKNNIIAFPMHRVRLKIFKKLFIWWRKQQWIIKNNLCSLSLSLSLSLSVNVSLVLLCSFCNFVSILFFYHRVCNFYVIFFYFSFMYAILNKCLCATVLCKNLIFVVC